MPAMLTATARRSDAIRRLLQGSSYSANRYRSQIGITMILLTDIAKMEIADSACYRHAEART